MESMMSELIETANALDDAIDNLAMNSRHAVDAHLVLRAQRDRAANLHVTLPHRVLTELYDLLSQTRDDSEAAGEADDGQPLFHDRIGRQATLIRARQIRSRIDIKEKAS